jgi:ribosomal protein S27E
MVISDYNDNNKSSTTPKTTLFLTTPVCNNERLITDPDSGEVVCNNCGRVLSDRLSETGPEWRTFAAAESRWKIQLFSN